MSGANHVVGRWLQALLMISNDTMPSISKSARLIQDEIFVLTMT
jgi:hypothetical protein